RPRVAHSRAGAGPGLDRPPLSPRAAILATWYNRVKPGILALGRHPMDKIRQIIENLSEKERQALLLELLIPMLKGLDGERCVMDDADEVVGYIMSAECRDDLIPCEVLDRLPVDASRCRPTSEMMKELKAR